MITSRYKKDREGIKRIVAESVREIGEGTFRVMADDSSLFSMPIRGYLRHKGNAELPLHR